MKRIFIIANGELTAASARRLQTASVDGLIAVDGGANHCRALGLKPDLLLGDLDSVSTETLAFYRDGGVTLERHPSAKNETDLELALNRAILKGAESLVLAGITGGRLDMTLSNLLLLTRPELDTIEVQVWDGETTAHRIRPPGAEISGQPGDTLSLIPLKGNVEGVETEDLAYPLRDERLVIFQARGLSNIFTGSVARVRMRSGVMLAVHTPGRA